MRKKNICVISCVLAATTCLSLLIYNNYAWAGTTKSLPEKSIKNKVDEQVKKISNHDINVQDMYLSENHGTFTLVNNDYEINTNDDNTIFNYTDLNEMKLKSNTQISNNVQISKGIFTDSKIDKFENYATEIANLIDDSTKKLTEKNYLLDNTIAYKWSKSYNNYEFESDFILVIIDAETGKLIQVGKMVNSKPPTDMNIKIDEDTAKTSAINYLKSKNLTDYKYIDGKIQIVNKQTENLTINLNTETLLAYCFVFDCNLNNKNTTVQIQISCSNGDVMNCY